MSSSLANPPAPPGDLRRFVARVMDDPESRSTAVGLLGVLIFYLLVWLFGPRLLDFHSVGSVVRPHASTRQFNIQIAPDMFVKPKPKPAQPFKFVETNPDAPENIPDKTENFSNRNQQVAQEKPTPNGKSDHPALEGQTEIKTSQIVTGQLSQPVEQIQAVPLPAEATPVEKPAATPKQEQNPLSGFEKKQGDNPAGFGSNVAQAADNAKPIPQKIEGQKNASLDPDATAVEPAIDPMHPRPRPQVVKQQKTRPAIFTENKFGTSNIGNIAVDAKWSNYGAYLQRLIETVQIEWDSILEQSKSYPGSGTYVAVKFILDSEGKITRIVDVDNHSTEQGSRACVSAITNRSPYGPWTEDMKQMLGEQQEMTFTFYYQ